jgi:hypothetical protein
VRVSKKRVTESSHDRGAGDRRAPALPAGALERWSKRLPAGA